MRESLRKYSVVPTVVRLASTRTTIGEGGKYVIPKGATIMVNMQGVHHNPANWPDYLEWQPERFYHKDLKPYTFMPFVEGPRNCLGQFLSLLESKCVISMLLRKYNFVLQNPHNAGEKHLYGAHNSSKRSPLQGAQAVMPVEGARKEGSNEV